MARPVAVSAGSVELTVGAVVSAVAPVVKLQVLLAANALPTRSVTPVVIVAVTTVLAARSLVGLKVATVPTYVTTPGTGVAPCVTVKVVELIVAGSIASLKVAVMF